jgi:hypothetical protein
LQLGYEADIEFAASIDKVDLLAELNTPRWRIERV